MTRVSNNTFYQRAFEDFQSHQSAIAKLQQQIGSGRKILQPSDDPAGAARSLDIQSVLNGLETYGTNAGLADLRLSLEDTTLAGVGDLLVRVKELALAANSGIQTDESRNAYRVEVEQRLKELLDFSNVRDANGDYLFAGFKGDTQPFDISSGTASYNGDQGVRELQISVTRQIASADSGDRVFMRSPAGNGKFSVSAQSANTGTGILSAGSVVDLASYLAHDYSIRFTSATNFDVIDDTLGTPVLSGQSFSPAGAINFNGLGVSISGQPAAGDRFDISPNSGRPIFDTLTEFINAVSQAPANPAASARLNQRLNGVIADLDQAIGHVLDVRTSVGARQNALQAVASESEDLRVELKTNLSDIEDVELDVAIGRLQQRMNGLQAAQQTFISISRLNLFDLLR